MMKSNVLTTALTPPGVDAKAQIPMSFRDPVTQLYNAQGFLRANSPAGAMTLSLQGKFRLLNMRFSGSLSKWVHGTGCMHISAEGVVSD
jgi:hypothetical protein